MMKVPNRPHFVIRWMLVGRIDPQFTILNKMVLHAASGVYVIFSGRKKVQYVGITFNQSFAQRVGQHLQGIRRIGGTVAEESYLYVGMIEPRAYKKLSWKMLGEMESLLVWIIKPEGNTAKRNPYRGREMLVENVGDEFGLPKFLYVVSGSSITRVGYGKSLDRLTFKTVSPYPWFPG